MGWAAAEFMPSNDRCNERNVLSDNGNRNQETENWKLETGNPIAQPFL